MMTRLFVASLLIKLLLCVEVTANVLGKWGTTTARKQPKSYLRSPTSEPISYPLQDQVVPEYIRPSNGDMLHDQRDETTIFVASSFDDYTDQQIPQRHLFDSHTTGSSDLTSCISNMLASDLDHDGSLNKTEFQMFVRQQISSLYEHEDDHADANSNPDNDDKWSKKPKASERFESSLTHTRYKPSSLNSTRRQQIESYMQTSVSFVFVSVSCYTCYEMTQSDQCCIGPNKARIPIDHKYDHPKFPYHHHHEQINTRTKKSTTSTASSSHRSKDDDQGKTDSASYKPLDNEQEHHPDKRMTTVINLVCPYVNQEIRKLISDTITTTNPPDHQESSSISNTFRAQGDNGNDDMKQTTIYSFTTRNPDLQHADEKQVISNSSGLQQYPYDISNEYTTQSDTSSETQTSDKSIYSTRKD
jgi:hypothetical protein